MERVRDRDTWRRKYVGVWESTKETAGDDTGICGDRAVTDFDLKPR